MGRVTYQDINFRGDSAGIIARAVMIAEQYQAQGYNLTLRQLYYQFVARDLLPNSQQSYKRLGSIINDARLAGYLDWDLITDRTRNLQSISHWSTPASIVNTVARQFTIDHWTDQPVRVEVWVEKEALADVVGQASHRYDVPYFSCRGYVSQSEMWAASQRLREYIQAGQRVVVIHLGDHDPSGIDMSRDIKDRLTKFIFGDLGSELGLGDPAEVIKDYFEDSEPAYSLLDDIAGEWFGNDFSESGEEIFEVRRIALNMAQVRQYNPPPNPAKITDSRAVDYIKKFGQSSWELDALDPTTLAALITDEITDLVDHAKFEVRQELVREGRRLLRSASDRWSDIVAYLEGSNT